MSSDEKRPPKMVDDRLVVALSHETREQALVMCSLRPTSTKEIADALDTTVSAVWYHIDKLQELGCIEEVGSKARRGATERFYTTTSALYFDSDAWKAVPREQRLAISMRILGLIAGDVDEAVRAKTVASTDRHLSRTIIDLDAPGKDEAYAVLADAVEGLIAVRENCAARVDKGGSRTTRRSFVLMELDLPPLGER